MRLKARFSASFKFNSFMAIPIDFPSSTDENRKKTSFEKFLHSRKVLGFSAHAEEDCNLSAKYALIEGQAYLYVHCDKRGEHMT